MANTLQTESGLVSTGDPMLPVPYRIRSVRRELADTFTWRLEPCRGSQAFPFVPGQFNMLYAFGLGEVPISISGDPGDPQVLIHTTRAVGSVTRGMREFKRGDTVGVRGPFGMGWPVDQPAGCDIAIIAGGIGLAPLRPVVYHVLRHRDRYGNVCLLYGARSPAEILFSKHLQQWAECGEMDVHVTVDRADAKWKGGVGLVTTLIERAKLDPARSAAFVCGPEVMMRFVAMALAKRGVEARNIFVSLGRNMKCAIGFCGHCQFGPSFLCKDGPVFRYDRISTLITKAEV